MSIPRESGFQADKTVKVNAELRQELARRV